MRGIKRAIAVIVVGITTGGSSIAIPALGLMWLLTLFMGVVGFNSSGHAMSSHDQFVLYGTPIGLTIAYVVALKVAMSILSWCER